MNYNLFDDMFVYESMLEGFDVVKQDYDGLRLLAAREDAGTVLVNLYKAYKLNDQSQLDRSACLRLDYLETMHSRKFLQSSPMNSAASLRPNATTRQRR